MEGDIEMYDNINLFTQALGLQDPWKLNEVKFDSEQEQLDIHISYNARKQFPCPDCQAECSVFDTKKRTWRHLNFFQFKAYIRGLYHRTCSPYAGSRHC
ncbi:MAG TPA: transposase family protein [Clostridia bacterium]|nr:transposase family protein [Clostridia bacterium]